MSDGNNIFLVPMATSFTFHTPYVAGSKYSVKILEQPDGMVCDITNGEGVFANSDITNVVVNCSFNSFSIGGTVTGLTTGDLILRDLSYTTAPYVTVPSNPDSTPINFTMAHRDASGGSYTVVIARQPAPGYLCSIANGSGVATSDVTDIAITCSLQSYPVHASITGLTEPGLVLSNGGDQVPITAGQTTVSFPTLFAYGARYNVTISQQPDYQQCAVSKSGSGVMGVNGNVNAITISCGQMSEVTTFLQGAYGKLAFDSNGNAFAAFNDTIVEISPQGVVSTFAGGSQHGKADGQGAAASFFSPAQVAIDQTGNLYVSDLGNNLIRKITPSGFVTTFAGSGIASSNDGASTEASFNQPRGIAVDNLGNVYVTEQGNNAVRKISPTGTVSTFAGSKTAGFVDGSPGQARFNLAVGLAVDAVNNVYVADTKNQVIRIINPLGTVKTFAGTGGVGHQDG